MGAAVGMCLVLYACARILTSASSKYFDFIFLGFAVALTSSFRFSLLPFLVLGLILLLWLARDRITRRSLRGFIAALGIGLAPSFAYNFVRMGTIFLPATKSAQFAGTSDLQGNIFYGLYGLLLSPNKGLFWFAPILLLLFATPWTWAQFPKWLRQLTTALGVTAVTYILLIAKIRNWGTFGWGPRYLVPVLPILFVAAGANLTVLWRPFRRPLRPCWGCPFS